MAPWLGSSLSAQMPPPPQQWPPAATRVIATYGEMMKALDAQMAAGGADSMRMNALEARLAEEVKASGSELIDVLRTGDYEAANAAAYGLRYASNAEEAIHALLAGLGRLDGGLTNNIGLSLEHLSKEHSDLIPLEPLATALLAHDAWNNQQKIAQVIQGILEHRRVSDDGGALSAALIPMLASQRVRVFSPAREILPRITELSLGNDVQLWATWYLRKYGRRIDIASGVYELAQIVHLQFRNGAPTFRVEGRTYSTDHALLARLRADSQTTRALGRKFGVVLQVPETGFPEDQLTSLVQAALALSDNVTVSPESDEFVPFSTALRTLRRASR
jgi:hypothetical protein